MEQVPNHLASIISNILLFFGVAGIAVPLLQKLQMSPVLAYLLCGIAIGPNGLSALATLYPWLAAVTIDDVGTVQLLGELGIVTLMFMIGLELSLERLKDLRRFIFGLGSAQILVTAVAIFSIAVWFGNALEAAILLGASFALSSTAIVMKLLEDRRLNNRPIGILCFSILLMQDLAVVPILVLAASFTGAADDSIGKMLLSSLGIGICTVFAVMIVGKRILAPAFRTVSASRNPEWLVAFVIFFAVACAAITEAAGLSLALGAFLAGLLIAETEFKHEVEAIVSPLKGLLLGIFFLSVGMAINVIEVVRQPLLLALSVFGIFALKGLVIYLLCLCFRVQRRQAVEAALYLAQPGEFALLILGVALTANLMATDDVQFFLLVTALAMMATPLVFKVAPFAVRLADRFAKMPLVEQDAPETGEQVVIIAGFGRVGKLLGDALADQNIAYIAFDNNAERVQALRQSGYRVVLGDAKRSDLWRRLHSGGIAAAVIATDDHAATRSILRTIQVDWPLLPVIVRAKDTDDVLALYDMGAKYVVAETLESSLSIVRLLMKQAGKDDIEIEEILRNTRERGLKG
ncbi:MAG: cation:proton antiporter [Rhodospirillales bacterium]|jgi:CPA2 family monovalent cation:H+ antiporter-2